MGRGGGGGNWEAGGAQTCSQVQQVTMTTLWVASTQAPSYCQSVEINDTWRF